LALEVRPLPEPRARRRPHLVPEGRLEEVVEHDVRSALRVRERSQRRLSFVETGGDMAVLGRKSAPWITLACAAAALTGCAWLKSLGGGGPLAFSHARHVGIEKLDCANCHADVLASDEPGMPEKDTCTVCHADIDAGKPPERKTDGLFQGDAFAAAHASALNSEIHFSHKLHAAGQACESCHHGIDANTRVTNLKPVRMGACMDCHVSKKAP